MAYVSARPRAQLVDALLAAQIALYALRAAGALFVAVDPGGAFGAMLLRGARISQPFLLVLFLATAIAFLFWVERTARNLTALGAKDALAPTHAVGVFFAPLVNLVAIPYVVWHLWRNSDPTAPRRTWLMGGWWASLLLAWPPVCDVPLVSAPLLLASALCLLAIVRDTQRRQDEQSRDDELRRMVPLPTADALR